MQSRTALLAALALLGTVLAGCSGSGSTASSDAISVEGTPGSSGPYTFTAKVTSEDGNYTWDMGDHLTTLYGKSVTFTYDFKDSAPEGLGNAPGNITVQLKTNQAGAVKLDSIPLRIGTGMNAHPTFVLEAATNWNVLGEKVTFSAAGSTDPDHDHLRYSWRCLRIGEAKRQLFHSHGNIATYQTPKAGSVTSYKANHTLPEPTRIIPGDLCETLGKGIAPSTDAAVIQGTFTKTGKYTMVLVASDGPHPTVSGAYDFYVTPPGERPEEWQRHWFNATMTAGADAAGEGSVLGTPCGQAPSAAGGPFVCDQFSGNFSLDLGGLVGWVNVTYDPGTTTAAGTSNNVTWELRRNGGLTAQGSGRTPDSQELTPSELQPGAFTLTAKMHRGAKSAVTMAVTIHVNRDPFAVY